MLIKIQYCIYFISIMFLYINIYIYVLGEGARKREEGREGRGEKGRK